MECTIIKTKVKNYFKNMNREKIIEILFQIMIFSSFWGPVLFPVTVPGIGEIYLFRVAAVAFFCMYLYDNIKKKQNPFKGKSKIEYTVFALVGIMVLYGMVSVIRAIDVLFTIKRLFNLCFDLLFFISIILYINTRRKINATMYNCLTNILVLQIMGVYEVFFGGIFHDFYDNYKRFPFFDNGLLQFPVVSQGNTNNYSSLILFCLPFLIVFLIYLINKSDMKRIKFIYSTILVVIISLSYFLVKVAGARLVEISMYIVLFGLIFYIILFQRNMMKILIACLVILAFVYLMENYRVIRANATNFINLKKYEMAISKGENKDLIKKPDVLKVPRIPSKSDISLKDQFFINDENSNEIMINAEASAGIRLKLLTFAFDKFIDSKGIGVGFGNTEQLARAEPIEKFNGLSAIHCFIARIIADMGVFVIIPACILVILIFNKLIYIVRKFYHKKSDFNALIIFTIVSILCFPILSTSPSDAQDLLSMWLSIAVIIIAVIRIPDLYIKTY